jgi:hypothetical protein
MELSLGVRALMSEIDGLAKARGFAQARVQAKVNVRRELVIALLIPARTPDEWGPPTPSAGDREAKRLARDRRG